MRRMKQIKRQVEVMRIKITLKLAILCLVLGNFYHEMKVIT